MSSAVLIFEGNQIWLTLGIPTNCIDCAGVSFQVWIGVIDIIEISNCNYFVWTMKGKWPTPNWLRLLGVPYHNVFVWNIRRYKLSFKFLSQIVLCIPSEPDATKLPLKPPKELVITNSETEKWWYKSCSGSLAEFYLSALIQRRSESGSLSWDTIAGCLPFWSWQGSAPRCGDPRWNTWFEIVPE